VLDGSRIERLIVALRTPRGVALLAWAACFGYYLFTQGIPLDRWSQTLWILLFLFAAYIGKPWRTQARILLDWLPFVGFLYLYDLTRGIADKLGRPVHVTEPLAVEKWLFHGNVPTAWLQQHFYGGPDHIHWWDTLAALTYVSHFLVVWIVAAVLYARSRAEWVRWARRILMLSYAGLLTYILYPAAPPWYAAGQGLIPGAASGQFEFHGLNPLGLRFAGALVSQGQAQFNAVAALPSLHAAFTAMLTAYVWPRMRWWGRALMVLYTLAMATSLVYGGEHYVFDVLLGYLYVAVVLVTANRWERWRAHRRAEFTALEPAESVGQPA
jgi:membrane-associated phospholipid phosphatase